MDSFLQQQRERGAFDSSSGFSVNPFKAMKKMAAFQSGDPGFYLLRLIQAGVLMNSSGIKVVLGRYRVAVVFLEPELEKLSPQSVQSSFGHTLNAGDLEPHNLFMNGLNHLIASKPSQICINWDDGRAECTTLLISEEKMTIEQSAPGETKRLEIEIQRHYDPRALASEAKSIYERAACCPIPVSLDGLAINTVENPHSNLYRGDYPEGKILGLLPKNYVLAECGLAWKGGTGLASPKNDELEAQISVTDLGSVHGSVNRDLFYLRQTKSGSDCLIRIPLHHEKASEVTFVQAGVTISTLTMPFPGFRIFLCTDYIETDLTGTQLRTGDKYREMVKFVQKECYELLGEFDTLRHSMKARFDWTPERKSGATIGGLLGSTYLFSAWALLPVPFLGKIWAAGMLASAALGGTLGRRSRAKLDEELVSKLQLKVLDILKNLEPFVDSAED